MSKSEARENRKQGVIQRRALLEHAKRMFWERGYAATSTRDICASLGLAHSAIYNYFPTKEDLLFELMEAGMNDIESGLHKLLERTVEISAYDRLVTVLRYIMGKAIEHQAEWRLLADELHNLTMNERRSVIVARRDAFESILRNLLRAGVESHQWAPLNVRLTGFSIYGIIDGICGWYKPNGPLTADEVIDFNIDFVLRGIGARSIYLSPKVRARQKRTRASRDA